MATQDTTNPNKSANENAFDKQNLSSSNINNLNPNSNKTIDNSTFTTPATIVTSTASKQNYANNVDSLNKANDTIKRVQAGQTASGIAASLGLTPEQFLKLNPNFAATGNKGDFAGMSGIIQPGQTYNTGAPVVDGIRNNNTGGDGAKSGNTGNGNNDAGDAGYTGNKGTATNQNAPTITNTTTNSDGSSFVTYDDGSGAINYSDGSTYKVAKGQDYTIAKLQSDNIRQLEKNANDVNNTMTKLASYSVETDPAAVAAANRIKEQYGTLIQQMKDKNTLLAGSQAKNSARSGMLQYANEMDTNFKSMELDKANQRVADLIQKEEDAIAKSNEAYRSGNVKALEAAQKEYNQILTDKSKSVQDFAKMVTDQVKANSDEIKNLQAAKKDTILNSIKISDSIARDIATQLNGETDPAKIDDYLQKVADGIQEKYGTEIDPSILKSSVEKEINTMTKESLANQNTVATINKKKSGPSNSGKNYTATNIPDNVSKPLLDDLEKGKATKNDLFRLYPEVSTSYISSLYNQYHPKGQTTNPFAKK